MRIAVAGGTGLMGRMVVDVAQARGHTPVVAARATGVDLTTGVGLDSALDGVDVIVDVTNIGTQRRATSVGFFEATTRNLLRAAGKAGVAHHIALSIVGVDRVHLGYYAGKVRQEELVLSGPVPVTVLRATQFHEFAAQMLGRAVGPFVPVPRMRTQPIAALEVAEELVDIAAGEPRGRAPDLAGPEVLDLVPMTRQLIRKRGLRKLVVPIPLPGLDDKLLPVGPGPRGTQTYAQWLSRQPTGAAPA